MVSLTQAHSVTYGYHMLLTEKPVLGDGRVIVPPKTKADSQKREQKHVRFAADLRRELQAIERTSSRDKHDVIALLLEWAVGAVEVPKKEPAIQDIILVPVFLARAIEKAAEQTGRSENEVFDILLRRAVLRHKAELELAEDEGTTHSKKKP